MELISTLLQEFKIEVPKLNLAKSEQDDIINHFKLAIDKERGKRGPVKFMAVKMKLHAIRNDKQALREFYATCLDYKRRKGSFSKAFFGATKI